MSDGKKDAGTAKRNMIVDAKKLKITLRKSKTGSNKDGSYKVYDVLVNGQETDAWLYAYKGSCHSAVAFCHMRRTALSAEHSLLTVHYPVN